MRAFDRGARRDRRPLTAVKRGVFKLSIVWSIVEPHNRSHEFLTLLQTDEI